MDNPKLTLELLSGPLDGLIVTLDADAEWSSASDGPLSFPWDEQLGLPQARLSVKGSVWYLEPLPNGRSTRHNGDRIDGTVPLTKGDLLKAANSWLLVTEIESREGQ